MNLSWFTLGISRGGWGEAQPLKPHGKGSHNPGSKTRLHGRLVWETVQGRFGLSRKLWEHWLPGRGQPEGHPEAEKEEQHGRGVLPIDFSQAPSKCLLGTDDAAAAVTVTVGSAARQPQCSAHTCAHACTCHRVGRTLRCVEAGVRVQV